MFGFECCCCDSDDEFYPLLPEDLKPFSLPSPLPQWPQGEGFATGRISLGELEVAMVKDFESISSYAPKKGKTGGVTFYKPVEIPDGFFSFGHYCQSSDQQLRGYLLVARDAQNAEAESPPLKWPLGYELIWNSGTVYVWQPSPPDGYRAMGFVVTTETDEPNLEEVRCVRDDLTEDCEVGDTILDAVSTIQVWNTKPCKTGMFCKGVSVGTFFCSTDSSNGDDVNICCLRNMDPTLHAMPNLNQVHALIDHYGPTVFFHPDEVYLPSSVPWFFKNGALLFERGKSNGISIDIRGSNLPKGGKNDGEFWLDLPEDSDDIVTYIKRGNLESAELYVHIKPALGGAFTDIAMWVFCPFNGPVTFTVELLNLNIEMNKVGEHIGDWEHFTLRVSNFDGELWSVYFSEHSGGEWVDASNLEFIEGNKPIVYSSKCGHASFPNAGTYIQGSTKLGIGVKNDVAQSDLFIDASKKYQIIAAEYLGGAVPEPDWLQYMREWGPTVLYDARSEIEKIVSRLPFLVRLTVETLFDLFPVELYGEEGPTGPKEKDNWYGDERC